MYSNVKFLTENGIEKGLMTEDIQLVDVKTERIRFLYRSATTAVVVNIFIAILTVWILWERVDHQRLLYWFGLLIVITALRAFGVYNFNKKAAHIDNISFLYYLFLAKSTLSGFVWGMSIWVFTPFSDVVTPILIVFVLGGLTAGAAAVLGSVLTVYFLYVAAIMLPITLWFYLQPSDTYSVMAIMLVVYMGAMMMAGYLYRKVLIKSITLSNDLVEAKNNAEVANQAKSKFLSSMSHELKTPLNSILGFAQLLEMDAKYLNKEQRESVGFILHSGHHLLDLVGDVLDLAKIEAGETEITIEDVNFNEIVAECMPLLQVELVNRQINFNNNIGNDDFVVRADSTKLKQVLLNLLNNAIKYNLQGGSVTLSCHENENNYLTIEISDTGKGIAKENQDKLFMPFERLGYENSETEGTGIGLIITKQIIDSIGGKIGFNSEEGKGSTFWVELPLVSS